MNTAEKVKTLFWIVTNLKSSGHITLKELNSKWVYNPLSEGRPFDRNTFRNHLNCIEEIFGITIEYTRNGYSIDDSTATNAHSFQDMLVSHVQDIDFYTKFKELGDKIQTDDIPGGAQYLDAIGKALTENLRLHIEHRKFVDDKSRHLTIEPYCIKSKERRWYLLARNVETGEMRTYALDRMLSLELTEEHFTPDSSIDLNKYYSNCIGVYTNNTSFTEVVIRVTEFQAKYLHTLPLHSSQREISPCVFKYQVDVTPDLINEILKMGANAEVLEPLSLRETVMGVIEKMNGNYCKEMIYL